MPLNAFSVSEPPQVIAFTAEEFATRADQIACDLKGTVEPMLSWGGSNMRQRRHLLRDCMRRHRVECVLMVDGSGLAVRFLNEDSIAEVVVDFADASLTYRREHGGGRGQLIAKALGLAASFKPTILDLTAGLGRDAFVLAALGCRVTLVERNPVVCLLLAQGIGQARGLRHSNPELAEIVDRMDLVEADGHDFVAGKQDLAAYDAVYLDPMFPERSRGGKSGKAMQALQAIVGSDEDAGDLLEQVRAVGCPRVVVKRPRKAPPLGGARASLVFAGKANRFDVYLTRKKPDSRSGSVDSATDGSSS